MHAVLAAAERHIYLTTFVVSTVFSLLAISTDTIINHDGIRYISAAKAALHEGIPASFEVYHWPFYSLLTAAVHQLSGLHPEHAAHLLNIVFAGIACLLFIRICEETSDSSTSPLVAAVIILGFVGINKYRGDIMRDFGYWCLFLAAILALLRYYREPAWKKAMAWQLCIIAATLFRVEGLVFLLLGPTVMLTRQASLKENITAMLPLSATVIAAALLAVAALILRPELLDSVRPYFGLLSFSHVASQFSEHLQAIGGIFYYDGWNLDRYYGTLSITLIAAMVAYLLVKLATCLGTPYTLSLLFLSAKRSITSSRNTPFLLTLVAIHVVFLFVYTIKNPAISPRYATTLSLILLVFLTHGVDAFLNRQPVTRTRRRLVLGAFVVLFLYTADAVISKPSSSKDYMIEAGRWLKQNALPNQEIYSNEMKIAYFADAIRVRKHLVAITVPEIEQNQQQLLRNVLQDLSRRPAGHPVLIALNIKRDEKAAHTAALSTLNRFGEPILRQHFENHRKDGAYIYALTLGGPSMDDTADQD